MTSLPDAALLGPLRFIFDGNNLLHQVFHRGVHKGRVHVDDFVYEVTRYSYLLRPRSIRVAFDHPRGAHSWRRDIIPSYKAHREPLLPELENLINEAPEALSRAGISFSFPKDGEEADDVIAEWSRTEALDYHTIIFSADKDLLQLVGERVSQLRCGLLVRESAVPSVLGVSAKQVPAYLSLTGDKADGIPGVPGVGPKTASQLLAKYEELGPVISAAKDGKIRGKVGREIGFHQGQIGLNYLVTNLRAND